MTIIAFIAVAEAMLFSVSHAKNGQMRRQQLLMGKGLGSPRTLPFVDGYLKRRIAGASRMQLIVASKLADVCRQAVHTRSFEYLLLHVFRTAILKGRSKFVISQGRGSI